MIHTLHRSTRLLSQKHWHISGQRQSGKHRHQSGKHRHETIWHEMIWHEAIWHETMERCAEPFQPSSRHLSEQYWHEKWNGVLDSPPPFQPLGMPLKRSIGHRGRPSNSPSQHLPRPPPISPRRLCRPPLIPTLLTPPMSGPMLFLIWRYPTSTRQPILTLLVLGTTKHFHQSLPSMNQTLLKGLCNTNVTSFIHPSRHLCSPFRPRGTSFAPVNSCILVITPMLSLAIYCATGNLSLPHTPLLIQTCLRVPLGPSDGSIDP